MFEKVYYKFSHVIMQWSPDRIGRSMFLFLAHLVLPSVLFVGCVQTAGQFTNITPSARLIQEITNCSSSLMSYPAILKLKRKFEISLCMLRRYYSCIE